MKILVIEDEPEMQELITQFLEDEHYVVEVAGDFAAGLDKIVSHDYDCILLDIMLPDGNGLDLLQELKKLNKADSVIILSTKDSLDDRVNGLDLGPDDYIDQSNDFDFIYSQIKNLCKKLRVHQANIDINAVYGLGYKLISL